MSNDRDTKFLGFAELLHTELQDIMAGGYPIDTTFQMQQQCLAQRAYDLVGHTIDSLWPYINDKAVEPTPNDIPDLTQWPEPPAP